MWYLRGRSAIGRFSPSHVGSELAATCTVARRAGFSVAYSVQIVSGLFEGYTGVVQSISEDMRTVTVLVKRGRRDVPVEMETSLVRPAQ